MLKYSVLLNIFFWVLPVFSKGSLRIIVPQTESRGRLLQLDHLRNSKAVLFKAAELLRNGEAFVFSNEFEKEVLRDIHRGVIHAVKSLSTTDLEMYHTLHDTLAETRLMAAIRNASLDAVDDVVFAHPLTPAAKRGFEILISCYLDIGQTEVAVAYAKAELEQFESLGDGLQRKFPRLLKEIRNSPPHPKWLALVTSPDARSRALFRRLARLGMTDLASWVKKLPQQHVDTGRNRTLSLILSLDENLMGDALGPQSQDAAILILETLATPKEMAPIIAELFEKTPPESRSALAVLAAQRCLTQMEAWIIANVIHSPDSQLQRLGIKELSPAFKNSESIRTALVELYDASLPGSVANSENDTTRLLRILNLHFANNLTVDTRFRDRTRQFLLTDRGPDLEGIVKAIPVASVPQFLVPLKKICRERGAYAANEALALLAQSSPDGVAFVEQLYAHESSDTIPTKIVQLAWAAPGNPAFTKIRKTLRMHVWDESLPIVRRTMLIRAFPSEWKEDPSIAIQFERLLESKDERIVVATLQAYRDSWRSGLFKNAALLTPYRKDPRRLVRLAAVGGWLSLDELRELAKTSKDELERIAVLDEGVYRISRDKGALELVADRALEDPSPFVRNLAIGNLWVAYPHNPSATTDLMKRLIRRGHRESVDRVSIIAAHYFQRDVVPDLKAYLQRNSNVSLGAVRALWILDADSFWPAVQKLKRAEREALYSEISGREKWDNCFLHVLKNEDISDAELLEWAEAISLTGRDNDVGRDPWRVLSILSDLSPPVSQRTQRRISLIRRAMGAH